jgi:hypothetical protein
MSIIKKIWLITNSDTVIHGFSTNKQQSPIWKQTKFIIIMILSEQATSDLSASKDTAINSTRNASSSASSTTSSSESYRSLNKSKSITSPKLANNSNTSANSNSASLTNSNSSNSIKILKSFYKKDALDSVNKSLLNIDKSKLNNHKTAGNNLIVK